jgi:hypothetical protein
MANAKRTAQGSPRARAVVDRAWKCMDGKGETALAQVGWEAAAPSATRGFPIPIENPRQIGRVRPARNDWHDLSGEL